jgi:sugar lactone lactonase YvrE
MGITGVVQQAGILWHASEKGVEGLDVENRRMLPATPLDARCFLADSGVGLLLCGTGNGIFSYQGDRWQALKIDGTGPGSAVRALAVDSQKMIWCASNLGLGKIVGSSQTGFAWQAIYDTNDGLPSRRIDCLCVDHQSTLWCGTSVGLARYQPQTDTFIADPAIESGVIALSADRQGQLFVATSEGLSKWDGKRWSALSGWRQHVAASATPQCLLADDSGYLWCGTSAGLVVRDEGIWQGIDLGGSVSVQGLAVDHQGGLWCATEAGLITVENWRGVALKTFLEKPTNSPRTQTAVELPTTIATPPPLIETAPPSPPPVFKAPEPAAPTILNTPDPSLRPTILAANDDTSQPTVLSAPELSSQPTVLNTTAFSSQPTVLDADESSSQPTVLNTNEPSSRPTVSTTPDSYIRLYASPTQSTIPIGGKEIFRIQVERQNTDANISFAGLLGSQGISATVIQKASSDDWANLLVTATEEAVPGNYTLRVQAEAPGIVIYSCSVEITVVPGKEQTTKIPDRLAPTLVLPTKQKSNLLPLVAVLVLFLGGGGLIWLLGRSAGGSATTPTPGTTNPTPTATSRPQPDPQPDPQATQPQPAVVTQPTVSSSAFGEAEAASLINNWQQIKQEIYSDPQNSDGESKLRSVLTGVMLSGSSGNGGRLNSWQQLRTEKQFWHYTQRSVALVPGTFQRVDDHTAFAVIAITESGEKFDSAGNLVSDGGSPYYNSTYQVKYRFTYDDQAQGWRLAECWGTTKTLKSCDLDRES